MFDQFLFAISLDTTPMFAKLILDTFECIRSYVFLLVKEDYLVLFLLEKLLVNSFQKLFEHFLFEVEAVVYHNLLSIENVILK